ncbi:MAG: DUF1559 domain-containing protein [Fuerstiella sp.]
MLKTHRLRNSADRSTKRRRHGFTLIELLVVISIIATLMSLILPAIQNAREAGRRTQCLNNIRNVTVACMNFASANPKGHLPALSYYPEDPTSTGIFKDFYEGRSWVVDILPYMDQQATYDRWQFDQTWDSPTNLPLASDLYIEALACPNDESAFQVPGGLTYVGNAGYGSQTTGASAPSTRGHNFFDAAFDWNSNGTASEATDDAITFHTGVFWPIFTNGNFAGICRNKCQAPGKIYDGSGNTIMLSENVNAGRINWANPSVNSCGFMYPLTGGPSGATDTDKVSAALLADPTGATLPAEDPYPNEMKNGPEGAPFPNSKHPGIVTVSMCDGSAKTLSESIDRQVYARLLTPAGSQLRTLPGVNFISEPPVSASDF